MTYPDTEPEEGIYEINLGFFWPDSSEPQYITVDFKLTSEMDDDYPGKEIEEKYGHMEAEQQRENWVIENLDILLDRNLVKSAFGTDEIDSVSDLDSNLLDMNFVKH